MQKCNQITGRVHSVETLGALDGPGLRYIVFMQGCPLRCGYCHNPDTWDTKGGVQTTAEEQVTDILRYRSYLSGGVTVSGGEPLLQPEFVHALFRECHTRGGLHCAVDTSGAIPLSVCSSAVDEADMILLDIKAFDDGTALSLTGSDTKNAWALLDYCEQKKKPVWIRHVLVPGITLFDRDASGKLICSEEVFQDLNPMLCSGAKRLAQYSCIERTDLLPFHKMGEFKWEELGIKCLLRETPEPGDAAVEWSRRLFADR